MEQAQDELALHQEDEVGASEEVGTTTLLDLSASAPDQLPIDQTPLNQRIVLPLQGTETPPSLAAYNPTMLATPQTSQGLSGAKLVTPTQPPVITGPGTPLQSSAGRPVPVTLNTARAAVAAPVFLEQITTETARPGATGKTRIDGAAELRNNSERTG